MLDWTPKIVKHWLTHGQPNLDTGLDPLPSERGPLVAELTIVRRFQRYCAEIPLLRVRAAEALAPVMVSVGSPTNLLGRAGDHPGRVRCSRRAGPDGSECLSRRRWRRNLVHAR